MKFCPECGAKLVSQKFCAECGEDLRKYTAQSGASIGTLGAFDFSALEQQAKDQLLEQSGMQIEGSVLVKYTGKARDVVIPRGVTEIYESAFQNNQTIASVVIPQGVKSIGKSAFHSCKYLQTVQLPDSLVEIYENAFQGCGELREIALPGSLSSIRENVFASCAALKRIAIPHGITDIGRCAFAYCSSLAQVSLPQTLTSIGQKAFSGCRSLADIALPTSLTAIERETFSACDALTSLVIPKGVVSIGYYAFGYCKALTSLTIPDTLCKIDINAFDGCHSLRDFYITDLSAWCRIAGLYGPLGKDTPKNLYVGGKRITDLTIPRGVTQIQRRTFSNFPQFERITVPDTVQAIDYEAFIGCNNLTEITLPFIGRCPAARDQYDQVFGYIFGYQESSGNGFPDATLQHYAGSRWQGGYYFYFIPRSLRKVTITGGTLVPYRAFWNCDYLTSITLPNTIIYIGANAFWECKGLTDIHIPSSVEVIGIAAFGNCPSLKNLTIPHSVTTIDQNAFAGCSALTVRVPRGKQYHPAAFDYATRDGKKVNVITY